MSTKPRFELEIIDGENMLALFGQLIDKARGYEDNGEPFKVIVRHSRHVPGGGRGSDRNRMVHTKTEIGLHVYGIEIGDPAEIAVMSGHIVAQDYYKREGLVDPYPRWLRSAMEDHGAMTVFEGFYNTNKRTGFLKFEWL